VNAETSGSLECRSIRTRRINISAYAPSRSRIWYRGVCSATLDMLPLNVKRSRISPMARLNSDYVFWSIDYHELTRIAHRNRSVQNAIGKAIEQMVIPML
jgi:hypothetical protein